MSDGDVDPAENVVADFIGAFARFDYPAMAALLADDLESYVTNRSGGVTLLKGSDAYMQAIESVDYATVRPKVAITQQLLVKPGQVMIMVEIRAERKGRSLHNFAAFLMDVRDGQIAEMRMVEALPEYSDSFWKD